MSTSGGSTWSMIDETMDDGYALALVPGAVYQGGSWNSGEGIPTMAVFKSTDNGGMWSRASLGTKQGAVRAIAVSPANPNLMFAGGYFYDESYNQWSQLYRSTDGGLSWSEHSPGEFNKQWEGVRSILFDAWDSTVVLLCTESSVYRSSDAGSSWSRTQTQTYNSCLLADPGVQDCYYLGTETGVYRSTNGGRTWGDWSEGLVVERVSCLTMDSLHRRLYAGTDGGGVCRLNLEVTSVDGPGGSDVPEMMTLRQNYPNPFNPSTRIELGVPAEGWYRLAVYNALGQEVAVLVDGSMNPGVSSIDFDASSLPTGVYLYRLTGPGGSLSRKMILIR